MFWRMVGTAPMARPSYTCVAQGVSLRACFVSSCPATPAAYVRPSALVFGSYGMVAVDADLTITTADHHRHRLCTTRAPGPTGVCMAGFSSSSNVGVTPGLDEEGVG